MGYKVESSLNKIKKQYEEYCENKFVLDKYLDSNYKELREFLIEKSNLYISSGLTEYDYDLMLALDLFEYLESQRDFTNIFRSGVEFWRYLSVYVIPDIVEKRWGCGLEEKYENHFYKKGVRIYPYTLYWFIYLNWCGSRNETYEMLKDASDDEILNLVERPSRIGVNVELMRLFNKRFFLIPKNKRKIFVNGKKISLYRVLLKKNTGKLLVYRPELYPNGLEGYVDMLFKGVDE